MLIVSWRWTPERVQELKESYPVVIDFHDTYGERPPDALSQQLHDLADAFVVHEPCVGLALARNCALRAAAGEILAFTDDDCRIDLHYVQNLLRHFNEDSGPVLRGGRVELGDPTDLPITIITEQTLRRWNCTIHSARYENIGNCLSGCNMAMSRGTSTSRSYIWRRS